MQHILGIWLTLGYRVETLLGRQRQVLARRRDERGSITIEQALWAVAIIALVGVVVAAITAFVKKEVGKIK